MTGSFSEHDRVRHVAAPTGEPWTVAIEPANAWQTWGWLRALERKSNPFSEISFLLEILFDMPFRLWRSVMRRLRKRKDWRMTVRSGTLPPDNIRAGATVNEVHSSRRIAADAAAAAVDAVSAGAPPFGTSAR